MLAKSNLNTTSGQALIVVLAVLLTFPLGMKGVHAQAGGSQSGLSPQEIEKLVGPIALYPDELVGIVLPASTNLVQVIEAARFLEKRKKDSSLQPSKKWDPSVLGLLNYPEVIDLMNKDLSWTQQLGDAVINQQKDVLAAIQKFRAKAQTAGNLKSNDKQVIIIEKEVIKIVSADPQVIYVPTYQPSTVVYVSTPVYYAPPHPVYYSPGAAFFTGMFVGAAIGYGVGWRGGDIDINRNVNISGGDRNVNVGGNRPSQQQGRGGSPGGRGGASTQPWKPGQSSKQRSAARTGGAPSQRLGGGDRSGGRGGASTQGGQRGGGGRQQARVGSQPSRSRGNSPVSGYKSGSQARANSSRGSQSRYSRGGSRSGGGSRGGRGGGRSRGGGRRR